MNKKKTKSPVSVNLDVTAKAAMKAELKAEVPTSSMGRLVDALTDAIRPFTEGRGLRADLIRLQREDVLIEIAHKANARIAIENNKPRAVPVRILVPLLEKSSWTDPKESVLVDAWSSLLASAATTPNPNHGIAIDILSKLDSAHVRFLHWISTKEGKNFFNDAYLDVSLGNARQAITDAVRENALDTGAPNNSDVENIITMIQEFLDRPGVFLTSGGVHLEYSGEYIEFSGKVDAPVLSQSIPDALVNLNILNEIYIEKLKPLPNCEIWVHYYVVSSFGGEFIEACAQYKGVEKSSK